MFGGKQELVSCRMGLSVEVWTDILKHIEPHENVFEVLKDKLKKESIYEKWEKVEFDKNYLFPLNEGDKNKDYVVPVLGIAAKLGLLHIVKMISDDVDINKPDSKGSTPIFRAVVAGFYETIKHLIQKGADVNKINTSGVSPLHAACFYNHLEIVELLIDSGADVLIKDFGSSTVLHVAARGQVDVLKYLLEELHLDLNVVDVIGSHPIHHAARCGNKDVVKYLLEDKGFDINVTDSTGANILHEAVSSGNLDLVLYLVEEKEMNVSAIDKQKNTTLLYEKKNNIELIEYLIHRDPTLPIKPNAKGVQPFHQAITRHGNLDLVKYYIEEKGADFMAMVNLHWTQLLDGEIQISEAYMRFGIDDFTNDYELSSVHLAAAFGHVDILKYLIEDKKIDYSICDQDGIVPLHLASGNGHLDVVKYLLDTFEIDPAVASNAGISGLHLAADRRHVEIMKYFVEEKGVPVDIVDVKKWTPLHFACWNKCKEPVEYLLDHGANINAMTNKKFTPLHFAVLAGHLEIVKYLITNRNADYNTKNYESVTPWYSASMRKNLKMIKFFFEDLQINCIEPNAHGWTPLYLHTVNGCDIAIVKYFIDKGARLDVITEKGRTVVQGAIKSGNIEVVKYLVEEKHVSLDTIDVNGHTPLFPALEKGHFDLSKYLIEERGLDVLQMSCEPDCLTFSGTQWEFGHCKIFT